MGRAFYVDSDGVSIVGTSPVGRATCDRLDVNDARHNDGAIVAARRLWVKVVGTRPSMIHDKGRYNLSIPLANVLVVFIQEITLRRSLCHSAGRASGCMGVSYPLVRGP